MAESEDRRRRLGVIHAARQGRVMDPGAEPQALDVAYSLAGDKTVATAEMSADGAEMPAAGDKPLSAADNSVKGPEMPAAGAEMPAAGAEDPVAGAEEPAAGAEMPAAGAEEPAAGAKEPADARSKLIDAGPLLDTAEKLSEADISSGGAEGPTQAVALSSNAEYSASGEALFRNADRWREVGILPGGAEGLSDTGPPSGNVTEMVKLSAKLADKPVLAVSGHASWKRDGAVAASAPSEAVADKAAGTVNAVHLGNDSAKTSTAEPVDLGAPCKQCSDPLSPILPS